MGLDEFRDIIIIIYGVLGIVLFLVLIAVAIGVWLAMRSLVRSVRELLTDPLRPTLDDVRETMHNVRGTSEFIADRAVHPVIRTVAAVRGVRRGLGVVTGLRRRGQ